MQRRRFLKVSGLGFVAAATADGARALASSQAVKRFDLQTSQLRVAFDLSLGLPAEFELLGTGRIDGTAATNIEALIFQNHGREIATVSLARPELQYTSNEARFLFKADVERKPAASFVLRYEMNQASVQITLEDVREVRGFEFLELQMPSLVTVRSHDENAWLAHADTGGSLVYLRDAKVGHLKPNTFWGDVAASLPITIVGNSSVTCVQEVTSFTDGTTMETKADSAMRIATLGTVKKHRVNSRECYDMNLGSEGSRNCGTDGTPNLLIGQTPASRLDFLPAARSGVDPWLAAAKLVRERTPKTKTTYYDDKFVYGIHCDEPKYEKPRATFKDCAALVRKVAKLIGGAPQVVHLWGWQYRGKDTGYPAVAKVNERLGGVDELRKLMNDGRKWNSNITFSDNYDDAYKSSPAWDPAYIARRPDGELWESRNWTGENSFIIGLAKYMAGPGADRVRYTCEHYGLRDSTHVDVLSYFSIRNDWDRLRPASGFKNLIDGRYKVLDEFGKHGVDVSSEAMRYAFIGKISLFWHMPRPEVCPFGGSPIPLMATVYRHSAIWGEWGRVDPSERLLNCFFYGNSPHAIVEADMNVEAFLDSYYLVWVPLRQVHRRKVEMFRRDGDRTTIGLEGNSLIDLDWKAKTYSVSVGGIQICSTGKTFAPQGEDRIAFYSQEEAQLSAPLPAEWTPFAIQARSLSENGARAVPVNVRSGKIVVEARARAPVLVFRDKAASEDFDRLQ